MKLRLFSLLAVAALVSSGCKDKLPPEPTTPSDTVACWPLHGSLKDVSGNGHDGSLTFGPGYGYIKDRFGNVGCALRFPDTLSSQNGVTVTNTNGLNFTGNDSYTISGWIYAEQPGSVFDLVQKSPSDLSRMGYRISIKSNGDSTNFAEFEATDDSRGKFELRGIQSFRNNSWHMITVVVVGHQGAYLYVDSALDSYVADPTMTPELHNDGPLYINGHDCDMSDILILNKAVDPVEVAARFHEGGWYYHKDSSTTTPVTGWVKGSFQTPDDIEALWFAWHDTAYACGFNGSILRSIDGGANWAKQISGTTNNLYRIRFLNYNMGYAGGNAGTLVWTQNAGINWNPVPGTLLTANDNIRDLYCGGHIVIAVGGNSSSGFIITSTDDGKTWTKSVVTSIASFYGVAKVTNVGFIAVGSQGQVYKTTDPSLQSWTALSVSDNPNFESVCCSSGGFIWAGTFEGVIYGSSDGGITWPQRNNITTGQIRTLYTVSDQNLWAAGDNGVIVHSNDGGLTWQREDRSDFSGQWNNFAFRESVQPGEKRMIGLAGQSGEYYYYLF